MHGCLLLHSVTTNSHNWTLRKTKHLGEQSWRDVSIISLPLRLREAFRRGWKITGVRGMEDTKETWPSKHCRSDPHVNSQKLWWNTQGLHWSGPDRTPMLREEWTQVHILIQKLQLITAYQQNNSLSLTDTHWVYTPFLRPDPIQQQWPTQNELNSILKVLSITL